MVKQIPARSGALSKSKGKVESEPFLASRRRRLPGRDVRAEEGVDGLQHSRDHHHAADGQVTLQCGSLSSASHNGEDSAIKDSQCSIQNRS